MKDFKNIYKRFLRDLPTTLLFSLTITIGVFLIYLIFVGIFNTGIFEGLATSIFGQLFVLLSISMIIGLVAPFIYSFFACNGVLNSKKRADVKYTSFLKTYMIGTRPPFHGQLRIWDTLIKSFLIYLLIDTFSLLMLSLFAQGEGSAFAPLFNELGALNMGDPNYLTQLELVLHNYKDLIRSTMMITGFFSTFFSTYFFIHAITKNTIRYFLAPALLGAPNRLITYVYRMTMRQRKGEYRKLYFKTLWPLTILYVVSFTLTYFLIGYLGPETIELPLLNFTSILVSVIVLLPFLPIVFNFHESIWPSYSSYFLNVFIEGASKELSIARTSLNANQTDEAKKLDDVQKNLEHVKKLMEEASEKFKEVKQDDDGNVYTEDGSKINTDYLENRNDVEKQIKDDEAEKKDDENLKK